MANLSIRKLNSKIYEQLRLRAAKHRVSMEEEVRQIISEAVSAPEQISKVFQKYFGPSNGVLLPETRHLPHDPLDFTE